MDRNDVKLTRSLGAKTLLFAILPTVIILLGIIIYSTVSRYTEVRKEAERSLQNVAGQVASEIQRSNAQAAQAARLMAFAQEIGGLFGNRLASVAFARRVLEEAWPKAPAAVLPPRN